MEDSCGYIYVMYIWISELDYMDLFAHILRPLVQNHALLQVPTENLGCKVIFQTLILMFL